MSPDKEWMYLTSEPETQLQRSSCFKLQLVINQLWSLRLRPSPRAFVPINELCAVLVKPFPAINDGREPEEQLMGASQAWTLLMKADKCEVVGLIASKGRDVVKLFLCVCVFSFY